MTELLIDVGNSRCKYACVENHRIGRHGAFALNNLGNLSDVARQFGSKMPEASYMISVASRSANSSVADAVSQYFGHTPILLDKKMPLCGISSRYRADQLGIDRVTVIVAAWQRLAQACIVIDCGTAVTIDFIDDEGVHRGGVILPSDDLMRSSLSERTARLNYFANPKRSADVFATDTENAVACGCRIALVASVSGAISEMIAQFGREVPLLATGGGAYLLDSERKEATYSDSNILFKNLSVVLTLGFEGMLTLIKEIHGKYRR